MTPSRAAELLEVDLGVSVADLKTRWRQLAKKLHPDVAGSGHLDRFVLMRQAYDTLLPVRVSAEQRCRWCEGRGRLTIPSRGFGGGVDMPCTACNGAGKQET